jgi:hypothetical protein
MVVDADLTSGTAGRSFSSSTQFAAAGPAERAGPEGSGDFSYFNPPAGDFTFFPQEAGASATAAAAAGSGDFSYFAPQAGNFTFFSESAESTQKVE